MNGIAIFSMSRAGHHAILHWICKQLQGSYRFDNNSADHITLERLEYEPESMGKLGDHYVTNFEDMHPNMLDLFLDIRSKATPLSECDNIQRILVVRDAYNLFASRIHSKDVMQVGAASTWAIKLWKDHCRAVLNPQNGLKPILYNKWFVDVEYRKQIIESLGGVFTDAGKNVLSEEGRGSSFDGMSKTDASKLLVLERYKDVLENSLFRKVMEDNEVRELNQQIFGFAI